MLISRSDIQTVVQLSNNLTLDKLTPHILAAQELDLKPQLGAPLYKALVDGIASSPQEEIYVTLMEGESYVCGNDTIDFPGVAKALSWYTYARYLKNQDSYSTAWGMQQISGGNSQGVSEKAIARKVAEANSAGAHYIEEMHKYLKEKSLIYTLYKGDTGYRRRGKLNIKPIG